MMKSMRTGILCGAVFAALSVCAAEIRALDPKPRSEDPNGWWQKRFAEKQALVRAGGSEVVFLGDSITHNWESIGYGEWYKYFKNPPFKALNLGYGGDRTEHVLWRIEHGELDGYKAKAIVLLIGTNNTDDFRQSGETPADTILGIREILNRIREKQPQARVILLPIFPRGATAADAVRVRNEVVNRELPRYANGRSTVWCDFNAKLTLADGTLPRDLFPDLLHPSARGYDIWGSEILDFLDRATEGRRMPGSRFASPATPVPDCSAGTSLGATPLARFAEYHPKWGFDWWANRVLRNRRQIAACGGRIDLVMMGDSITHFAEWPDAKHGGTAYAALTNRFSVLNCGDAGDSTRNLLWRALYGELDGYAAKSVMLMIGTNNTHMQGGSPEDTAAGIRRILDVVKAKQPKARILLSPIFPRGKANDSARAANEKANALIRPFADGRRVIWLDVNAKLVDAKGDVPTDLASDRLHPTEKGYRIWFDALERVLGK